MTICLSHGGPMSFEGSGPADQILVGTVGGVRCLERQDKGDWQTAWTALEDNHVSSIQIEPRTGTVFAGAYKGGLHASEDGGKTWEARDKGLSSNDVYSLTFRETGDGTMIYAGTEPAHLFKSADLGDSWDELPTLRGVGSVPEWSFPAPPHVAHVKFIAPDPIDEDVLYAGIEVGGLLKSTDGGETWEELHGFYEDLHRIAILRSDHDKVYITTGDGVYQTTDGGKTWRSLTNRLMAIAYPDAMVVVPNREDLMFIAGSGTSPSGWRKTHTAESRIARSRDGGESWELLSEGLPGHMRGNVEGLTVSTWNGSFELFAGTTDGDVYYSDDEGDHWTRIMSGLPPVSKHRHYRALR